MSENWQQTLYLVVYLTTDWDNSTYMIHEYTNSSKTETKHTHKHTSITLSCNHTKCRRTYGRCASLRDDHGRFMNVDTSQVGRLSYILNHHHQLEFILSAHLHLVLLVADPGNAKEKEGCNLNIFIGFTFLFNVVIKWITMN